MEKFKAWLETEEGKAAASEAGHVSEAPAEAAPVEPPKPDPITDLAQRLRLDLTQHVVDTITAWVEQRGAELATPTAARAASEPASGSATETGSPTASPSDATVSASEPPTA